MNRLKEILSWNNLKRDGMWMSVTIILLMVAIIILCVIDPELVTYKTPVTAMGVTATILHFWTMVIDDKKRRLQAEADNNDSAS